jgi:hypothetical protein
VISFGLVSRILRQNKIGKATLASLLVLSILLLSAIGASPTLHKLIHNDAGDPDHNCAISLFTKGHVNSAPAAQILVGFVQFFACVDLLPATVSVPAADYRYSSSRAPPAFPPV